MEIQNAAKLPKLNVNALMHSRILPGLPPGGVFVPTTDRRISSSLRTFRNYKLDEREICTATCDIERAYELATAKGDGKPTVLAVSKNDCAHLGNCGLDVQKAFVISFDANEKGIGVSVTRHFIMETGEPGCAKSSFTVVPIKAD